jgi:hypothetical protein
VRYNIVLGGTTAKWRVLPTGRLDVKKLMYASIAILCLAVAFHLGAVSARSTYVDHMASGIISHYHYNGGGHFWVLDEDGIVWYIDPDTGWYQSPALPVPVSQVKFWTRYSLVTFDHQTWFYRNDAWEHVGSWPGSQTPVQESSWGAIKARFREDG